MNTNYFAAKLFGQPKILRGIKRRYENGNMAIEIIDASEGYEERWAVLTVNPGLRDEPGKIWVKTWSENEELFGLMVREGMIVPSSISCQCGFAQAIACEITSKFNQYLSKE